MEQLGQRGDLGKGAVAGVCGVWGAVSGPQGPVKTRGWGWIFGGDGMEFGFVPKCMGSY